MTRFARERTDAQWYRGLKIPETVIRNIDEKTKLAVSGSGGSWAPTNPIILEGEGLELQCALQLEGGTTALAKPGTGSAFIFGDDDYFRFTTRRTRIIHDSPFLRMGKESYQREARPWGNVLSSIPPSIRCRRANAHLIFPLRIPDGSYLASVEIGFYVGQSHANVPSVLPHARIIRIDTGGVYEQHPNPTTSVRDREGWVYPTTPVSGAAWYNGGAMQALTLTFDHAAMDPADTSVYAYGVEWYDESGTNAYTDDIGTHLVYFKTTVYQEDLRPY